MFSRPVASPPASSNHQGAPTDQQTAILGFPLTCGITPTTLGPHELVVGHPRIIPATFYSPLSISRHLGTHGSFLPLLTFVGLCPTGYKACTCSALRQKKEPRVSNTDIHGLMDGGAYMAEARSWRTPQSVQQTAWRQSSFPEGRGESQLEGN